MVKKRIVSAPARVDISAGWPDSPPYRDEFGGYVLNVAINRRVRTIFDLETGTFTTEDNEVLGCHGLGASGARDATYLVAREPKNFADPYALIKNVWCFENIIVGHRGGVQDQLSAIFGGGDFTRLGSGPVKEMIIDRIPIPRERLEHLQERLVLVNTGEPHLSSNIHDDVFGEKNYQRNVPRLRRMSEIAHQMYRALTDETEMGKLISETWELQKALHPSIETEKMRELQEKYKGKYLGCKATGAGGGGFLMFYTTDTDAFKEDAFDFKFDFRGLEIKEYD